MSTLSSTSSGSGSGFGSGWERLLRDPHPFRGDGRFPIAAYSELMPGPFVGLKPSGTLDARVVSPADLEGFPISEYEEAHELRPGLALLAERLLHVVRGLGTGKHALPKTLLEENPYWPELIARQAGQLAHERYLLILPLALSRTLDDKGRVRWTLFGASEQGPARPFWQSFYQRSGEPLPVEHALGLLRDLIGHSMGLRADELGDLRKAGLRLLRAGADPDFPSWGDEPIPDFLRELELGDGEPLQPVRWLLTFRPFARLAPAIQSAYLEGRLQLLPFPGSLVFFGDRAYRLLARRLPLAMQIPLLHLFPGAHATPAGLRILQSGWLEEPHPNGRALSPGAHAHGPLVSHVKRTSRWNRTERDEDETSVLPREEKVAHVLFSAEADDLGLYGKPMARNAQLWTHDPAHGHQLLLDGPNASPERLHEAARALAAGGHFGYRFLFPPMRVGRNELYWHRPLVAFEEAGAPGKSTLLEGGPLGYLTAYGPEGLRAPVELWPRLLRREGHIEAAELFEHDPGHRRHTTAFNVRKLLEASEQQGGRIGRNHARQLLTAPRTLTLDGWLESLPERAADLDRGRALRSLLEDRVRAEDAPLATDANGVAESLTLSASATRAFEERYWRTIADLAEGRFVHKDNADHAGPGVDRDRPSDLPGLADELHARYHEIIARHGMTGRALVGDHWFRWRTDFDFPWAGGWVRNQAGHASERNVVLVIPGNDRSEAVLMGDHYDTAYMEDVYEKERGGDLTRRSAAGADDNHSATAALLAAAELLLPLSKAGRLARDVWLVHLTGEEFPADCLGARNLVQRLVERNFAITADGVGHIDLSHVTLRGAFILDMVAHNVGGSDRERYIFQIAPGEGSGAAQLALQAHLANERWNRSIAAWNQASERASGGPSQRMEDGSIAPAPVAHPAMHGEIRPGWHFKSSLYNTDAQIFSDAGIPVVLFMENYDINRQGYHDTHDTMKNIDLDYGAALVAIAIEAVAQVAAG